MPGRHEMMDICDRCGKRFNPVSCGGLLTLKQKSIFARHITLCDDCYEKVEKFLWERKDFNVAV